jgi:5'-3' exonuclease
LPSTPVVAEALRHGREVFRANRVLATLRDDVPLNLAEEALAYHGPDTNAVRAVCDRLGFDRLRDQILDFAGSREGGILHGDAEARGDGE